MLQRALTIVVGAPLLLLLLALGPLPFTGVVAVLLLMALREFYAGCRTAGSKPAEGFGFAAGLLLLGTAVPLLDPQAPARFEPLTAGPYSALALSLGLTLLVVGSLVAELRRPDRAPLKNL